VRAGALAAGRCPRAVNAARTLNARAIRAVLCDLDGTLIDTAADIARALNRALAEQQLGSLPEGEVRRLIGRGVATLIDRALTRLGAAGTDAAHLRERFDVHYEALYETGELAARVYPGARAGLEGLHAGGWRVAVVTNKPTPAAMRLLGHLRLSQWLDLVVGGEQGLPRKPHPEPLLAACERLAVPRSAALMVGDSLIDVEAARAAGMPVVCVPYGYNEGQDPRTLSCDGFVQDLSELPALLGAPRWRADSALT
jgi:phosphoglycolate phosphatase